MKIETLGDLGAERARYDAAAYGALRRRRRTLAARAAAANARALAAVSGRAVDGNGWGDKDGDKDGNDPDDNPDDDPDAPLDEAGVRDPADAAAHADYRYRGDEDRLDDDPGDDVDDPRNLSGVTRSRLRAPSFRGSRWRTSC